MGEGPPAPNGAVRWRPVIPTAVVVVAIVVAVGAVSGLVLLLYQETRGPGEILRQFARAVDEGDCAASYDLLDQTVHRSIAEEEWCGRLPQVNGQIDADFDIDKAVLQGDEATVRITGTVAGAWTLRRHGERSWRVLGPAEGMFAAG
jgi:hypothetical protein